MLPYMEKAEEKQIVPNKSFMAFGPTLHYSHTNVRTFWILSTITYIATCMFWSKIVSGNMAWMGIPGLFNRSLWDLGNVVQYPLSIFEYPWQIYVLGLVMGIIATSPVIVSQLLSFRFCIPMILASMFIAKLPLFGLFLLISCVAVACRPLRFRSRFISIALCMAPQLIYWAMYGGVESVDPIKWGFSFSPWVCAWLTGLLIAGIVLAIGHYTRYKPGPIWVTTTIVMIWAIFIFQLYVSLDELDYQLYIANDDPEKIEQFQTRSLTEYIDSAMRDNEIRAYLDGQFYPDEPILLREELKREIRWGLDRGSWPIWFPVPEELDYQQKRNDLIEQYNKFIKKRPKNDRIPIALYYKGMVMEYKPDVREFGRSEKLQFHNDVPNADTLAVWWELFHKYSLSPESLEARWRIAMNWAGIGQIRDAEELCKQANVYLANRLNIEKAEPKTDTIWTAFSEPATTALSQVKLQELGLRLKKLEQLLNASNIGPDEESVLRLSRFVRLNKYKMDYPNDLKKLLSEMKEDDPLKDNVLLALAMIEEDLNERGEKLMAITEKYGRTDAGIQAKFELGLLNVKMAKETEDGQTKDLYLDVAKKIFENFVVDHRDSIFCEEAQTILNGMPRDSEAGNK